MHDGMHDSSSVFPLRLTRGLKSYDDDFAVQLLSIQNLFSGAMPNGKRKKGRKEEKGEGNVLSHCPPIDQMGCFIY